ncbi:MAG: alpha/beta fold hydrolase [Opitutus sp.]
MKHVLLAMCCCGVVAASGATTARDAEIVVLLHGLGRTSASMNALGRALQREGFRVVNPGYASRTKSLESLATEWLPAELAKLEPAASGAGDIPSADSGEPPQSAAIDAPSRPRIHFVTHSMGGIIVRLWLRECGVPENLGRVVMLAPPNQGSEIADRLQAFAPFRWFTGVNGRRLGTAADALPRTLGPWPAPHAELGIIAGSVSLNPLVASWIPRPNDGKVSVVATHLAGERDHVVVPASHTWIARRRQTIAHVTSFLHQGRFTQVLAR